MRSLDQIAIEHGADKASTHHGYTRHYERLFEPMRMGHIKLLEIGVQFGASIKTWLEYFPGARIVGVDIANDFKTSDPRYTFIQADQGNPQQMRQIAAQHQPLDIVIDDGCHLATHVHISFQALWPAVIHGGLYIIEDCFTFWHPAFHSSLDGSIWLGDLIGEVNQHGKQFYGMPNANARHPGPLSDLEKSIDSIFFSKGLMVLTKR